MPSCRDAQLGGWPRPGATPSTRWTCRGNRTTDAAIIDLADREQRAVVTKDADFVDSHTVYGQPPKLLLVSTGNLSNTELEALLVPLIPSIMNEFLTRSFLELGPSGLVARG